MSDRTENDGMDPATFKARLAVLAADRDRLQKQNEDLRQVLSKTASSIAEVSRLRSDRDRLANALHHMVRIAQWPHGQTGYYVQRQMALELARSALPGAGNAVDGQTIRG
jgi:hypothetical protein